MQHVWVLQKRQIQLNRCFDFKMVLTLHNVQLSSVLTTCVPLSYQMVLALFSFNSDLSAICELSSPLGVASRICLPSSQVPKQATLLPTDQQADTYALPVYSLVWRKLTKNSPCPAICLRITSWCSSKKNFHHSLVLPPPIRLCRQQIVLERQRFFSQPFWLLFYGCHPGCCAKYQPSFLALKTNCFIEELSWPLVIAVQKSCICYSTCLQTIDWIRKVD